MSTPTLLIIEDDTQIRQMYADAFASAGVKVLLAQTGEEGIKLALDTHPNLLLVDIGLPDQSGHMVVNKIRKDSWGKNAKVIFLTNYSDPENITRAIEQGSEEYIVKANTDVTEVINKARAAMY